MNQDIIKLLQAAIECSVFLNPTEPGLSYEEILEVGKLAGFQTGEVGDAALPILKAGGRYIGDRIIPDQHTRTLWGVFFPEEPDYRNFAAFDFVVSELNDRVKADGARNAQLDRSVIVERALAKAIQRNAIEVAITYLVMANQLTEKDGVLRFPNNSGVRGLPSEQLKSLNRQPMRKEERERAYPIVKDIIERRTDGRPQYVEPLDAFAEELDKLGHKPFSLWWTQTVAELRHSDPHSSPVSALVLAAAIVEGVLTFVVKHARSLGAFRSPDFDRAPKTWKIDDLVKSAAKGATQPYSTI